MLAARPRLRPTRRATQTARPHAPETWRFVGAAGEPDYVAPWRMPHFGSSPRPEEGLRFLLDDFGLAWLAGAAERPSGSAQTATHIFTLPPGYGPPAAIFVPCIVSVIGTQPAEVSALRLEPTGEVHSAEVYFPLHEVIGELQVMAVVWRAKGTI